MTNLLCSFGLATIALFVSFFSSCSAIRDLHSFPTRRSSDLHPPNCMFSCLQILEAFLWFVLITLLNVTLIILKGNKKDRKSGSAGMPETDLVCRLLLEKKKTYHCRMFWRHISMDVDAQGDGGDAPSGIASACR